MKKKIIGIVSGLVSAVSLAYFYDKYLNKSKLQKELLNAKAMQFATHKITPRDYHSNERFFRENPLAILLMFILLMFILLTFLIFNGGLQNYLRFFQTSMIQMKYTTEPFDGTVAPISKVPKWTDLTPAERNYTYSQIPANKFIPLPRYNVADFRKGMTWRENNERERNAYITYPVPNLGNYKLDGTENSGSHTGLDIKAPKGTPVHAISRGVVVKAKSQTTGFGKHIVIMHKDVPDPRNPAKKTTLYSAYAHLSQIKVKEGDQVRKGQIIGLVGDTGMTTTPHLHFQIDTADAPFHPYWAITWRDVVGHGLSSFFEAVKNGVNKNLARKYTVHPMNLVNKFISYTPTSKSRLVASAGVSEQEISRENFRNSSSAGLIPSTARSSREVIESRDSHRTKSSQERPSYDHKTKNSQINRRRRVVRRNGSRGRFRFKDSSVPVSNNRIRIASRRPNRGITTLHTSAPKTSRTASARAVNRPTASVSTAKSVQNPALQQSSGQVLRQDSEQALQQSSGQAKKSSFQKYGENDLWFEMARSFIPGIPKKIRLYAKDSALTNSGVTLRTTSRDFVKIVPDTIKKSAFQNGFAEITITTNSKKPFKIIAETAKKRIESPVLLAKSFTDVSSIGKERIFAEYADKNKIITANARGEFRPNEFLNRAESVKAILTANKIKLNPAKKDFQDVNRNDWFAKYVTTAFEKGLVSGYPGDYFKPANSITKAEFLKMALLAKGINPRDSKFAPYRDVPADSWYEPYFSFARNNGLLAPDSQGYIKPNKTISRIEAAQILYKLSQLR